MKSAVITSGEHWLNINTIAYLRGSITPIEPVTYNDGRQGVKISSSVKELVIDVEGTTIDGALVGSQTELINFLRDFAYANGGGGTDGVTQEEFQARNAEVDENFAKNVTDEGEVLRVKPTDVIEYTNVVGTNYGAQSGLYNRTTGAITASVGRKRQSFPLVAGQSYAISGVLRGATTVALACYFDSSGAFISSEFNTTLNVDHEFNRYVLSPPAGAVTLGTGNINAVAPMVLESFATESVVIPPLFPKDVYSKQYINPIRGKRIFDFGDSIMAGSSNFGVSIAEQIASRNDAIATQYAVGGATVGEVSGSANNIPAQVDLAIAAGVVPDIIVFDGYTNDITNTANVPLGDISSGYTAALDKSTFSGGFEYVIKSLKQAYPSAIMVYVKVHKMSSRPADKQESYSTRAHEICKKWSVPVVDLYNEGLLNTNLPYMAEQFTANADITHPNQLGYDLFYVPSIESEINRLSLRKVQN